MQHTTPNNPWKGLQSYSEGDPIYGRNHDIVQLSRKIIDNPQTVIYGESGNGKTSILRAGIFPILRQRNFFPVLIRLDHKDLTLSYNAQIFEAVEGALKALRFNYLIDPDQTISGTIREVRAPFDSDKEETLWEYFHRREFFYEHPITHEQQAITPVLVFDQFEEIFSLQTQEHATTREKSRVDFFTQLTNLLNEIRPDELILQDAEVAPSSIDSESDLSSLIRLNTTIEEPYLSQANCHLVFSLRNDYLAHLERYTENIPSLKHNRYCLLPLSEDQAAEIIMRPIPDYIPVQVAKVIIGKIADVDPDSFEIDDNPELEVSAPILSLYLYELFEKNPDPSRAITVEMIEELGDNLIDNFYLRTVNDATKISAESVAVLEDLLITKDRKRDHSFHSRLKDRGVSEEELNYLIDKRILNEFPTHNGMRIEFSHDKLCRIICKNRQERQERKRQEAEQLQLQQEQARLKALRKKNIAVVSLLALLISAIAVYIWGWHIPVHDRYANFTKQHGWPKGLNALTKEQAQHLPFHFVLKKKGYFTPHYSIVECRNSYDSLCCNHSVSTYIFSDTTKIVNQYTKELFAQVCQWEFVAEQSSDRVIQERFYDKEHHLALTFNRDLPLQPRQSATNAQQAQKKQEKIKHLNNNTFIGKYTDPQGLPLISLDKDTTETVLICRITYDKHGYEAKVEYFDIEGDQTMNNEGAYQTYYEYDQEGRLLSQSSLNRYGKRMIDQAGNCGIQCSYNEQHPFDPYLLISVDEFGRECTTVDGWSRLRMRYDEWGRVIEGSAWRMEGDQEVAATKEEWGAHAMHFEYDDRGNKTNLSFLDTERDILGYQTAQYDALGRRIHEDTNGTITEIAYAGNGEVRQLKYYTLVESDTTWLYRSERQDTLLIQYNYTDPLPHQNITHYDRQGRIVEDVYYELDGITPLFMPSVEYHKAYWRYDDEYQFKGWMATTQTIQEYYTCDSQEPYRIDTSYKIEDLNRTLAERHENGELTSIDVQYDNYENLITQYVNWGEGDYKVLFERSIKELNEKTDGIQIGYLTRYGFPTDKDTFTYGGHSVDVDITDVVDSLYQMPKIYRQERNRQIVFIEVTDGDSEPWYGVVMHTARGRIEFGAADYTEENNGHDPYLEFVTLLNLTTMQIERINTSEYKFVDLFNYPVGEQEYAIYEQRYNKYKENPLEPLDFWDRMMCKGWDYLEEL